MDSEKPNHGVTESRRFFNRFSLCLCVSVVRCGSKAFEPHDRGNRNNPSKSLQGKND